MDDKPDIKTAVGAPPAGQSDCERTRPKSAMINAGWNALGTFWNIAISFVLTPLLIHSLGTEHYGVLLLIWSVTGVLGVTTFGLGEATLRYVAHHNADGNIAGVNRVFGSTLTFYLVVCGLASATLFAGAPWVAEWLNISADQHRFVAWLLRLSALSFLVSVIAGGAFATIPMALHRYDISSKIAMAQGVVRSGGLLVLAAAGFGLLHLVVWDLLMHVVVFSVGVAVARRLLPSLRPLPSLSLTGFREIFGYSVFTFLTHVFLSMYRESGKLLLGARNGPSSVAYFGTPDSVAYRLYMILVSGGETLLPRFSAIRDRSEARHLLLSATWTSLALAIVLLVPLAAVMPDLLRLWIGAEFAGHSASVGRLVAVCYIAPAAFVPIATYFRGVGRPAVVTAVMAAAGIVVLAGCALLVPRYGIVGVGYAYLLSCIPWFVGLVCGWAYAFGRSSIGELWRPVGVPVVLGGVMYAAEHLVRGSFGELSWMSVFTFGGILASVMVVVVFGADWALGGDAPSRKFVQRAAARFKGKLDTVLGRPAIECAP